MEITLARIDNRLLHGIVITQYLPSSNAKRIMVIDDEVAKNELKKSSMAMAKPNGYASSIITLEKAKENILANKYKDQKIFLLVKSPNIILELLKIGVKISELIVGCTDLLNEGIKLSNRAFVSEDELSCLKEIENMGTDVVIQHASSAPKVSLKKIIK